jgi:hypothetical protein
VEIPLHVADLPTDRPGGDIGSMGEGVKLGTAIKDALGAELYKAVATTPVFVLTGGEVQENRGDEAARGAVASGAVQRVREAEEASREKSDDQVRPL